MPPSIEVRCLLHQLAAHGNDLHAVCEGNNACSRQCGVFTERKPAAALNSRLLPSSAAQAAMEWVKIAIWLFSVRRAFPCRSQSTAATSDRRLRLLPQKPAWQPASSHKDPCPCRGLCALTWEKMQNRSSRFVPQNNNQTLTAPYFNRYSSHKVLLNNSGLS